MTASENRDPIGLQAQLDVAATELGLARCVDQVVIPATRQLRGLVSAGQQDAAHGVLATEAVRTWLNRRGLFAPTPRLIGPIVLACGPRDRQLVPLESLALLLRFQRWPCRVLGARVSAFTLTVAAKGANAAGVVVMSSGARARSLAVTALRAVEEIGIPVFFAGEAFVAEPSRRGVPGQYLGTGIEDACGMLITSLAVPV